MEKFKLDLSALKVESFKIGNAKKENGTVKGNEEKCDANSTVPRTRYNTCYNPCPIVSVNGTCFYTCLLGCSERTCDC